MFATKPYLDLYCYKNYKHRPVFLLLQPYDKDWFAARNISNNEALADLAKIFYTQIKIGLQYLVENFGAESIIACIV